VGRHLATLRARAHAKHSVPMLKLGVGTAKKFSSRPSGVPTLEAWSLGS
jgi:hypothetical protein